jgi:hypothetical protein
MLRLLDSRTGQARPVESARPRQLRIHCDGAAEPGPVRLADLRASLVADLIHRLAELNQFRVSAWRRLPGGAATFGLALRAACDDLNIYPFEFSEEPPGSADVSIVAPGTGTEPGPGARHRSHPGPGAGPAAGPVCVRTGHASFTAEESAASGTSGASGIAEATLATTEIERRGLDPLALRLAFLCQHYRQAIELTWETLEAADRVLRDWRKLVADWASSPSQPMNGDYLREVFTALEDDLDTPAALDRLRTLSSDGNAAPGSKFETFAYLDRVLGLDLAREIGR